MMTKDIRTRIHELRKAVEHLPADDTRKVAVRSCLSDAESLLKRAETALQRAEEEYVRPLDSADRLTGGTQVIRGY
jgi:hypothetical protein